MNERRPPQSNDARRASLGFADEHIVAAARMPRAQRNPRIGRASAPADERAAGAFRSFRRLTITKTSLAVGVSITSARKGYPFGDDLLIRAKTDSAASSPPLAKTPASGGDDIYRRDYFTRSKAVSAKGVARSLEPSYE